MSSPEAELQRRLLAIFQGEAQDHWSAIAAGLRALETERDTAAQQQLVETIFREAHTLKGAARLVGEREVEGLCDRLEEVFAGLKARRAVPDADQWNQLQTEVAALQQRLGLPGLTPGGTSRPSPSAQEPVTSSAPSSSDVTGREATVRVSAERVDALLLQAEELLALKATGAERLARWAGSREDAVAWRRRWTRLLPQVTKLRRWLDEHPDAAVNRELRELLGFVEWNEDYAGRVRSLVEQGGRVERRDQSWVDGLVDGLLQDTKELLVTPCAALLQAFPVFVRQAAASQGKEIEVVLEGAEMEVDRRVLDELREMLTHLVRNSIDHGIESPAERQQLGKPPRATLTLSVREQAGGSVEVVVADDGRGVDLEQVREVAVERQLVTAAAAEDLGEPETLALLFASGFSTSQGGSALSGRGLGLAIVKEKVERLGGSVSVEQHSGAGTTFRLVLPITLARFRGVFVQARGRRFVLPSTYVRQVLRVQPQLVRTIKQQLTLMSDGHPIPLVPLADLLRLPAAENGGGKEGEFAVVVAAGRLQFACRVDEIPYEAEIVMKNLGRLLPRVRHIAGATIVGAGQVVPVLNASDLVLSAVQRTTSTATPAAPAPAALRRRRVLVVEDSITSRTLLKSILQGAGFEVRTAVDGVEALTALKFESSDLVISDVQMPRLDGFELTRRIRSDPALSTLPVILVTSLASRDDKERGVDAGANAYVVKSSFDQSDLLQTIRRLL